MLYSEQNVRHNIRNRNGRRVFYLGAGDQLTPSARDWLRQQRIEILPAAEAKPEHYVLENGAFFREKPEDYTHLRGNILVPKTHPVIVLRGAMDTLQAELLLSQLAAPELQRELGEILSLARQILSREVMEEPLEEATLCGLTEASPDGPLGTLAANILQQGSRAGEDDATAALIRLRPAGLPTS